MLETDVDYVDASKNKNNLQEMSVSFKDVVRAVENKVSEDKDFNLNLLEVEYYRYKKTLFGRLSNFLGTKNVTLIEYFGMVFLNFLAFVTLLFVGICYLSDGTLSVNTWWAGFLFIGNVIFSYSYRYNNWFARLGINLRNPSPDDKIKMIQIFNILMTSRFNSSDKVDANDYKSFLNSFNKKYFLYSTALYEFKNLWYVCGNKMDNYFQNKNSFIGMKKDDGFNINGNLNDWIEKNRRELFFSTVNDKKSKK